MSKRTVLCFEGSNTHFGRYAPDIHRYSRDVRWPGQMPGLLGDDWLGNDWHIIDNIERTREHSQC